MEFSIWVISLTVSIPSCSFIKKEMEGRGENERQGVGKRKRRDSMCVHFPRVSGRQPSTLSRGKMPTFNN